MTMTAVQAWERFAARSTPRREVNAAGARTWLNWTQYPDHGPGETVLGDLAGKDVLELGSGSGDNLAHLASLGARCTGIDLAPTRTAAAQATWSGCGEITFLTAEAASYLDSATERFDIVFSIFGAVWFTDPAVLLPRVHAALKPGGLLAFSHLPAVAPMAAGQPVQKWELTPEAWQEALHSAGFGDVRTELFPAPVSEQVGTLLVRARGTDPGDRQLMVGP
ncbi:class I SAM-dependent methyltransferase [Crossiella sp. SN42]|uniref:class I SAM-dependent methyltransferase n=1 Tax=Crossiella sp. SN42 TaxID=2944808 RepID=UPI00207C3F95|nr:class I SAM-dependent methyltransferase [Crossiella sp. SN42]MCO1581676.1 class I SAM-dependent methyltransferase [Crossiella sp. SN42]